ncbi:MAG: hypothetical protein IJ757_08210 [Clostridiales bacterium]|nr:hypothetical protein [Clostridiales bacterium]
MASSDNNGKEASEYYELKEKAVQDLLTANEENSPEVPEAELRRLTGKGRWRIPGWLEVVFIKFWFSAAICYFFIWGLGGYLQTLIDQLFVIGIALGIITDLLTNNVIRFFAVSKGDNDKYMMFPKRSYKSFIGNILYAFVIVFLVYTIYNAINLLIINIKGGQVDTLPLGVEPILFGVFCFTADLLCVGAKNMLFKIIDDAKNKINKEIEHGVPDVKEHQ